MSPLTRAIIDEDPTARCLTGVGNSSAVYTNTTVNVSVMAPFPVMVNVVTNQPRPEEQSELVI